MTRAIHRFVPLFVALLATGHAHAQAADPAPAAGPSVRLLVEAEAGPLYIARNDGRYGPQGTDYGAADVGQQENLVVSRRLAVELGVGKSTFIGLWAPLDLTTRAVLSEPLVFRSLSLPAGTLVDHRYKFEGFRLSWLYRLVEAGDLTFSLGASTQIRNAVVAFTPLPGEAYDEETDIGVVFALKGRLVWKPGDGPWAMAEADGFSTFGLAGDVTGAIYDAALTLGLPFAKGADFILRARLLGGGAEVPSRDIYNWGDFVAATAGVRLDLSTLL